MIRAFFSLTGRLLRKNFPLLFSLLGHALVITVVLFIWRSFMAGIGSAPQSSDEQIFEIEIVSPEMLDAAFKKEAEEREPPSSK